MQIRSFDSVFILHFDIIEHSPFFSAQDNAKDKMCQNHQSSDV